jgi:hypothetical protein
MFRKELYEIGIDDYLQDMIFGKLYRLYFNDTLKEMQEARNNKIKILLDGLEKKIREPFNVYNHYEGVNHLFIFKESIIHEIIDHVVSFTKNILIDECCVSRYSIKTKILTIGSIINNLMINLTLLVGFRGIYIIGIECNEEVCDPVPQLYTPIFREPTEREQKLINKVKETKQEWFYKRRKI